MAASRTGEVTVSMGDTPPRHDHGQKFSQCLRGCWLFDIQKLLPLSFFVLLVTLMCSPHFTSIIALSPTVMLITIGIYIYTNIYIYIYICIYIYIYIYTNIYMYI